MCIIGFQLSAEKIIVLSELTMAGPTLYDVAIIITNNEIVLENIIHSRVYCAYIERM